MYIDNITNQVKPLLTVITLYFFTMCASKILCKNMESYDVSARGQAI